MIDIDDFKEINGVFGPSGQRYLPYSKSCLTGYLRALAAKGIMGRVGGDEFVVFFTEKDE